MADFFVGRWTNTVSDRNRLSIFLTCVAILSGCVAFPGASHAVEGSPAIRKSTDRTPFHLYDNGDSVASNSPTKPLPAEVSGVVVDIVQADTSANRRACTSTWLFDRAHEQLCARLSRHKIVAIKIENEGQTLTAFVPFFQTERIAVGDQLHFSRATVRADGLVVSLPKITRFNSDVSISATGR